MSGLLRPTCETLPLIVDPTAKEPIGLPVKCYHDARAAPPNEVGFSQIVLAIRWLQVCALQMIQRIGQLEIAVAERDRLDDSRSDAELDESRMRYGFAIEGVRQVAAAHRVELAAANGGKISSDDETTPAPGSGGCALDDLKV